MRLILTRHGETVWNLEGRVQGAMDSPLTEKGVLQARFLAKRLRREGIQHIYASDLPRAAATADEIRRELGLSSIILAPELRELSFGKWEGKVWWDLRQAYPDVFEIWDKSPHLVQIPGGETMQSVTERAWNFVASLVQKHQGETVCIVTHGMTLQLLVKKAMGIALQEWSNVPWQHNTAINLFEVNEEGFFLPRLIADCTHLEGDPGILPQSGFKLSNEQAKDTKKMETTSEGSL